MEQEEWEMSIQNEYLNDLMERVICQDPGEPEFHQAVREVLTSLAPVVNARPELITEGVMDCLVAVSYTHLPCTSSASTAPLSPTR